MLELRKNKWQLLSWMLSDPFASRMLQHALPLLEVAEFGSACGLMPRKKLFKEQAKTKAAVRDEFDRDARHHGRGTGPDSSLSSTSATLTSSEIHNSDKQFIMCKSERRNMQKCCIQATT